MLPHSDASVFGAWEAPFRPFPVCNGFGMNFNGGVSDPFRFCNGFGTISYAPMTNVLDQATIFTRINSSNTLKTRNSSHESAYICSSTFFRTGGALFIMGFAMYVNGGGVSASSASKPHQ